jgi:peroxiredoxin Q/BCP
VLFGRKYMGILRTTFVIDPSGKVSKVFEKVHPEGHGEEVAKFLAVEKART